MTILAHLRKAAAVVGIHAERLSQHPETKLLGLIHLPLDLILDVGANTGQFAADMRTRFPAAHIVSFEPNPEPFAQLAAWAARDGNATAVNCGIGAEDGEMEMHVHLDHSPSSSLLATTRLEEETFPQTVRQEMRKVRVRRLDDVLAELGRKPDARTLLKLDIQGFEEQALRGAAQTLATCGAFETEVSLAALYVGQPDFYTLYTIARDAGLTYAGNHYQHIGKDGRVVFLDALFVR